MTIALTSGMRSNLISLQNVDSMTQVTQKRLSTGKRVNSALDDPVNFFKAQDNYNRANDLAAKKDGMGEAIKIIETATTGIEKMEDLLNQMKSLASAAKTSDNTADLETQYNTVLRQVASLAEDANYGGQNLAHRDIGDPATTNQLSVELNEYAASNSAGSSLNVQGFSVNETASGLSLTTSSGTGTSGDFDYSVGGVQVTEDEFEKSLFSWVYEPSLAETSIRPKDDTGINGGDYNDYQYFIKGVEVDAYHYSSYLTGPLPILPDFSNTSTSPADAANTLSIQRAEAGDFSSAATIDSITEDIDTFIGGLRTESQKLSSSLSTIQIRSDFTSEMVNNLNTGADNLTLADMNEEGANMLMLQTRQNLGTTSLSLASQAAQAVLRLF
jgi:flagellin-like hook-associated protein FlgL